MSAMRPWRHFIRRTYNNVSHETMATLKTEHKMLKNILWGERWSEPCNLCNPCCNRSLKCKNILWG